jgi:osmotically-inducible protein OsmY
MKRSTETHEAGNRQPAKADARSRVSHRKTSDLAEQIEQALKDSGYAALGSVDVAVDDGHVTLRGPVRSFHLKQVATSVVLPLDGVKGLNNELSVTR